jgi:hypothetical protein
MLKRLLAAFTLKLIAAEDPFIRINYVQNAAAGTWEATLVLLESTREWSVRFDFRDDFEELLEPNIPPVYVRVGAAYHLPQKLSAKRPLTLTMTSPNLANVFGFVSLTLESKARVGGTILLRWIPIGLADSAGLAKFDESHAQNFEHWQAHRAAVASTRRR